MKMDANTESKILIKFSPPTALKVVILNDYIFFSVKTGEAFHTYIQPYIYTFETGLLITVSPDDLTPSGAGPRLTNGFSIAIQIRWKFRYTLISILIQWSLQYFVHGTTAVLSWHVQKFVAI